MHGRRHVARHSPASSRGTLAIAAALFGLTAVVVAPVAAQEDFRSLDAGRPVRMTDAYPVRFLEWEFGLGLRGRLADGSRDVSAAIELEAGLFRNAEVGFEIEPAWQRVGGESDSGIEGLGASFLYNFNQESWSWPAFSLRVQGEAPVGGGPGREDWAFEVTGIASRTFANRMRLHANAGYAAAGRTDGGDAFVGGVAIDAPLGLFSRLVIGDLFVEIPVDPGRTRVLAELGSRVQITNLTVVDFGLGSRIDEWTAGRSNVRLVLGITRVFGIGALVRVPAWQKPRID